MIDLSPRDQRQTEADDVYQSSIRYLEISLSKTLKVRLCERFVNCYSLHELTAFLLGFFVLIRGCLEMGLERLLQVCESTLLSLSIVSCGTLLTDK